MATRPRRARATLGAEAPQVDLDDVLSRRIGGPPPIAPQPAAPPEIAPPQPAQPARTRDDRKQIIVRMSDDERWALKQLAATLRTTTQALAEDAIRDILRRHGFLG